MFALSQFVSLQASTILKQHRSCYYTQLLASKAPWDLSGKAS